MGPIMALTAQNFWTEFRPIEQNDLLQGEEIPKSNYILYFVMMKLAGFG